jgi:hypothetical protein
MPLFGKRNAAVQVAKEVAPLLRELYPNKTDEQRATLLGLFYSSHGRGPDEIDDTHIRELVRTLRYYIGLRKGDLSGEGPQIEDRCDGCQEFKATLLEIQTGKEFRRGSSGRLVLPPSFEGESAEDFSAWVRGQR